MSVSTDPNEKREQLARLMYDDYSEAVGGKAFNGDPLPKSEEFFGDLVKVKQANAWRVAADTAIKFLNPLPVEMPSVKVKTQGYTTDPNDPRLGHGVDAESIPQHDTYLILSEEERAKGFVRPLHRAYVHVGVESTFKNPIQALTPEQKERCANENYVAYVPYDESERKNSSIVGRYFTQEQLDHYYKKGCGVRTTMGLALCETYARDPKFYGATYCCGCQKHLPVSEFVWDGTNDRVGS